MATGGGPFEEGMNDQDLPSWSNDSFDDRLNNTDWGSQQKKANRSSEKNKKKLGGEAETRLTNDISPESSPGIGRRKTRTPHSFPHARYMTQMSVPEQAELERLKQRINFSDLDQIVSRLVQIRDYIAKASSMRDDLVEKNERSANVERLSHLIDHLKEQEKSYLKFLQKMLARQNEEDDVRTIDSAVGSGSVGESTSLNIDVQSEASDTTARDPQQEAKEELENLKKQHDLLKRMLKQQEQLKALQGRQAALLALQHKAEQAIAVMDDSVVTETTGSVSGVSLTSELNEELNDLIQRFHNQLHDSQTQSVPDNRRQAESLSLTREVSQSRNSSMSERLSDEKAQLFNKMRMLQGKKQKMDKLLGELHTLRDQHLNNSSCKKLNEVRKRLNELRELVHYYEQTSDMMTDAVNENTKEEEETEESESDSEREDPQPVTNISNYDGLQKFSNVSLVLFCFLLSLPPDCHNREDDKDIGLPQCEDEEVEEDRVSEDSASSHRSSLGDTAGDAEFEQKINRLIAAKQKLRQLQNLAAMVQDDDPSPQTTIANASNIGDLVLGEMEETKQQPNNVRASTNKLQKDVELNEKAREKFYEAKLQQQQQELKQLQEERRKLIEIQEKIQVLQKACPDLQLSAGLGDCTANRQTSPATSTPAMNEYNTAGKPSLEFDESVPVGNECALDEEDGDEDGYLSDGAGQAEEDDDDASSANDSFSVYPNNNVPENAYFVKENKDRWKNYRPLSADGNYRPLSKARQQQNISMRRQENLRWMSELSYVEEKERWQEQINQLKKQHEFSVSICQTLMQDQQTLSCLLQTLLTGPYSMMPNNVASSQVHLIMHQLNQCYTQLTWQQNNVQRLKQMLNDLVRQQEEQRYEEKSSRKDRGSGVPPPPSPVFCPFSFPPQPLNLFNVPGFTNFSSFAPDINYNPVFPSGFGDFAHHISPHSSEQQQQHPLDHNASGKTEYMAFPKPFESSSSNGAEKQRRSHRQPEEEMEKRSAWLNDSQDVKKDDQSQLKASFAVSVQNIASNHKNQSDMSRRREFDEESLESFSSMPDPVDPTTVTKTFKSRKASAQASLASKDKTPKSKNKRKSSSQLKGRITNIETGSDLSMFEALRDTIYSEVATLISQNESRPHFLIELFHELQLLNTDYLRQRALYALQDIVTRHLSENNEKGKCTKSLNSAAWIASNSELTPSESLASTDDETFGKNFSTEACQDCEQNDADNGSSMSTSSNFEPFATDDLGNTVIHLDQALARMREYERMKIEAESTLDSEGCSSNFQGASAAKLEGQSASECVPVPQSSEASAVPCPHIDTQQLDRQIKAIMKEVIPFLKEHMDEVCSSQLLTSVRRMVLTLTQQNDESKEFVKFFHKQLGSILQDSLAKFAGRKLKDCGEDLLVEISEVLFNELAFFKLMQDLDNNSISVKQRCKRKIEATEVIQSYAKEDKDETETVKQVQDSEMYDGNRVPESIRSDASDQEEDDESESGPVAISLSKAETQALTNYGSGEDENEDEEIEFEEGPVDVQTSLQASSETTTENEQEAGSGNVSQRSDEDDFVKVEDLPLKLAVYSEKLLEFKVRENNLKISAFINSVYTNGYGRSALISQNSGSV
ncbi:Pcm1 [Columba guinea]|nr:Pcm1 [Columba guinea]